MIRMEKIQERALRFLHEDYTSDYNSLLSISKLPSLKLGRERSIATLTHKNMPNLAPYYFQRSNHPNQKFKITLTFF